MEKVQEKSENETSFNDDLDGTNNVSENINATNENDISACDKDDSSIQEAESSCDSIDAENTPKNYLIVANTLPREMYDSGSEDEMKGITEKECTEIDIYNNNNINNNNNTDLCRIDHSHIDELKKEITELQSQVEHVRTLFENDFESSLRNISRLETNLHSKADDEEFKKIKDDFYIFSRRLKKVAKEADAASEEVLDAAKIPPDVLEIAYSKTLNNIFDEIVKTVGERDATEIVSDVIGKVRSSSAGVDFFRFEGGKFSVYKLAEAIETRLVSPKQIHGTYVELFSRLMEYIPGYEARDFKAFVETGSMEYVIEKVRLHENIYYDLMAEMEELNQRISGLSDKVDSVWQKQAELEKAHDDILSKTPSQVSPAVENVRELADAINTHTKLIKKLNDNINNVQNSLQSSTEDIEERLEDISVKIVDNSNDGIDSDKLEDRLTHFNDSFSKKFEELETRLISDVDEIRSCEKTESEISYLMDEIAKLREDLNSFKENSIPDINHEIIDIIREENDATLKQIQKKFGSKKISVDKEELTRILNDLQERGDISSRKKGRYVYYSLKED